jgi:hypothetical protein
VLNCAVAFALPFLLQFSIALFLAVVLNRQFEENGGLCHQNFERTDWVLGHQNFERTDWVLDHQNFERTDWVCVTRNSRFLLGCVLHPSALSRERTGFVSPETAGFFYAVCQPFRENELASLVGVGSSWMCSFVVGLIMIRL